MTIILEPINGGLVSSRTGSALQQGELQATNQVMYMPDTDSLYRGPGGQLWSIVATATKGVEGLVNCRFENDISYLVAQASGKLWSANAESDGSAFASATINVTGLTTATRLVTVPFDNRNYIFNGVDANCVMLSDGTSRFHGLLPVTQKPTPRTASAVAFSGIATGYYEYWCTEVVKCSDGQDLESTFSGFPLNVYVTSLVSSPVIEMSGKPVNLARAANTTSISYNVYRSEMKSLQNDTLYPVGRRVGVATIVDSGGGNVKATYVDSGSTSNTGAKTAASNDTIIATGITSAFGGSASSVADALSVGADAKTITITRATAGNFATPHFAVMPLNNFSFGTFSGNIVAITVTVTAKGSVADIADIFLVPEHRSGSVGGVDFFQPSGGRPGFYPNLIGGTGSDYTNALNIAGLSGSPASKRQTINSTSDTAFTFGDSTDDWLPGEFSWNTGQIDSNFGFHLGIQFSAAATGTPTVTISGLSANIYYAGTNAATKPDQKFYDAVSVDEGGIDLKFGANGLPPKASMGCVFEGSLVTDDIDHPGKVCYSIGGSPDYMPTDVYFIDLPANESLSFMGTVNNRAIVATIGGLWRINYLPNEDDASFSRGRAFERYSDTVGIINPNCGCLFTNSVGQQEMAFVDTNGVFSTDGYSVHKLSTDLRWVGPAGSGAVFSNSLGGNIKSLIIALINDPRTQTLRMVMSSGVVYCGSYAMTHLNQDGSLKWTKLSAKYIDPGTFSHNPTAAICFRKVSGAWVVAYGYDALLGTGGGSVAREDSTDTTSYHTLLDSATQPSFTTRDLFLNGVGGEGEVNSIIINGIDRETGSSTKNIDASLAFTQKRTNAAQDTASTLVVPGGITGSPTSEIGVGSVNCEGFNVAVTPSTTGMFEILDVSFRASNFGEEELSA
jgi:hypothetical protein